MFWQTQFPLKNNLLYKIATAQSLTVALSSLGRFSVQVDFLGETCLPDKLYSRQVTLILDDVPVVKAQSWCANTSHWRDIMDCGTTPLGEILFSGSLKIKRSEIEFALPKHYLLARRSWFILDNEPLYLIEYFLDSVLPFCTFVK